MTRQRPILEILVTGSVNYTQREKKANQGMSTSIATKLGLVTDRYIVSKSKDEGLASAWRGVSRPQARRDSSNPLVLRSGGVAGELLDILLGTKESQVSKISSHSQIADLELRRA